MKKVTGVGVIIGVIVIAFAALVGFSLKNKAENTADYNNYNANAIIEGDQYNGYIADHVKGNANAPVLLFEYADYQCPGCASMNPRFNALLEEYGDKLGLVYRNYLLSYHQNGTAAATAAEAAAMQGYWKEYADMLFANQSTWEAASVDERGKMFVDLFAKVTEGKGDVEKFKSDMEKSEIKKKLSFDQGLGDKVGVTGTPSIYLNGEKVDFSSAKTEEDFYNLMRGKINAALETAAKVSGGSGSSDGGEANGGSGGGGSNGGGSEAGSEDGGSSDGGNGGGSENGGEAK